MKQIICDFCNRPIKLNQNTDICIMNYKGYDVNHNVYKVYDVCNKCVIKYKIIDKNDNE